MEDKSKEISKEVDATIKRALEEVRGRELTPQTVEVRVRVTTKEHANVTHHGEVDVSSAPKK